MATNKNLAIMIISAIVLIASIAYYSWYANQRSDIAISKLDSIQTEVSKPQQTVIVKPQNLTIVVTDPDRDKDSHFKQTNNGTLIFSSFVHLINDTSLVS